MEDEASSSRSRSARFPHPPSGLASINSSIQLVGISSFNLRRHMLESPSPSEIVDEYSLNLSQLFIGHSFAYGARSTVHRGKYNNQHVAVKLISIADDDENEPLKARLENQFNREVTHLRRLSHPNVIKLIAAGRTPTVLCIVTEYLSSGSLRSYLHRLEHRGLPLRTLVAFAVDIARGMEYIHSQGVIHRDLKPENILITEDTHMKIVDFGIACCEANCDFLVDDDNGTYRWMAPEMIRHVSYGRKVDVYSFGLILWEMASGNIPFEGMNPFQAAYAVVHKNKRPPIPGDCHPVIQALIEQCWSSEPDKRPEFSQIVEDLEQFDLLLPIDGTLEQVHISTSQERKKNLLLKWMQKLCRLC